MENPNVAVEHFVRFFCLSSKQIYDVQTTDVPTRFHSPKHIIPIPGSYAFYFFDRVMDNNGIQVETNESPIYYWGIVCSLKRMKKDFSDQLLTISKMEKYKFPRAILTRLGIFIIPESSAIAI